LAALELLGLVLHLLMAAGLYAYHARPSPASDLRELFPWDLSIGLDVLCGLALCAGGFTVAATIRILNLDDYKAVLRACLLTGFVGYVMAFLGMLTSVTESYRGGLLITSSPRLAVSGAVWLLIFYGAALLLEFAPDWSNSLRRPEVSRFVGPLSLALLLLAAVLSVIQQTSFADLVAVAARKASPLWATPQSSFHFFVSAVCGAMAAAIFVSWHTGVAFGRGLPAHLVTGLGKPRGGAFLLLGPALCRPAFPWSAPRGPKERPTECPVRGGDRSVLLTHVVVDCRKPPHESPYCVLLFRACPRGIGHEPFEYVHHFSGSQQRSELSAQLD